MVYEGRALDLGMTYSGQAISLVCVLRGEKEEDEGLVMLIPSKVMCYRFMSKKFEVLSDIPSSNFGHA